MSEAAKIRNAAAALKASSEEPPKVEDSFIETSATTGVRTGHRQTVVTEIKAADSAVTAERSSHRETATKEIKAAPVENDPIPVPKSIKLSAPNNTPLSTSSPPQSKTGTATSLSTPNPLAPSIPKHDDNPIMRADRWASSTRVSLHIKRTLPAEKKQYLKYEMMATPKLDLRVIPKRVAASQVRPVAVYKDRKRGGRAQTEGYKSGKDFGYEMRFKQCTSQKVDEKTAHDIALKQKNPFPAIQKYLENKKRLEKNTTRLALGASSTKPATQLAPGVSSQICKHTLIFISYQATNYCHGIHISYQMRKAILSDLSIKPECNLSRAPHTIELLKPCKPTDNSFMASD